MSQLIRLDNLVVVIFPFVIFFILVCLAIWFLLLPLLLTIWTALHRGIVIFFFQSAINLYTRASKSISSSLNSTSELPHLEIHRRRDLISGSAMRHEYPGVILSHESMSERMLNRYGRYLNLAALIPDTDATIFRIRSWLRNCEQSHNGRDGNPNCQPLDKDDRGYPLWLIDIEQRCVVRFQANLSYFALSYVWGRVETAKMERSNLVKLQQPGSLLGPHQAVELPKTIKDAMFLIGYLGHRYLWCDRLCLVQDDVSSKLPQIQQMAEIFARAYCTIVAFDNLDANSGLHGLPSLTICSQRRCNDYLDYVPFLSSSAHVERAHWSSRAWTFQEELFSVRIIQFSSHVVNWQCSPLREKKSTYGSNHSFSGPIRGLQYGSDLSMSGFGSFMQVGGMLCPRDASLEYYIFLAEEYSRRRINKRHPEDIFHAFSSVQSVLKASYPGAFVQGIPECFLVQCLLWQSWASRPKDFVYPVTGRKASSWSWIAWSARIKYPRFAGIADEFWRPRTCEGLVSWYASLKKNSHRYPVFISKEEKWTSYRKAEGRSGASISSLNASSSGKQDMSLEFQGLQHIIPLSADSRETSTLEAKNLCSFLHGRVLMARFRVHLGLRVWVLSCEINGDYAGVLCSRSDFLEKGQVINLIAISRGSTKPSQCCDYHRRPDLMPEDLVHPVLDRLCDLQKKPHCIFSKPDKTVYEFYDVLWVEYEDGVAYRKAIGRVRKEVWDRETLGWVDITLG